ncbi:E3 ubiquitin/ISG15 ligase TRIM25-like [Clinocottus analis]|uniref:E3 ubiquitin/ISG15 ligase TRIM25-like n=1 Tax=Clinocottus analis TaxID=304258 RepID=UPI0035BEDE96
MAEQQPQCGADLDLDQDQDQDQFLCSVCLDLLREPVTIPCGHSYCRSCIEGCWDEEEKKGQSSCPQCRESFSPRPLLKRNTMLAQVVEKLKKSGTQQPSPPPPARAGPEDVVCDFCCGTGPAKATMSCLTCLASFCPAHLEPHRTVPVLKKHQLVSATIPLQEKMCEKHNKLMEVYCRTDRKCICYLCVIDEHKSHNTVSSASARAEEQKQLIVSQKKVQQRFQDREKELNELLQALKDFKSSTQPAVETCDKIFDEMICSMKKKRSLTKELITGQQKTAAAEAEELQLQLEEEISKMKRRDTDLEQLSHTDDHIHFIQTFQSLSTSCESPDLPPVSVFYPQRSTFKPVTDCVSKLRDDMDRLLKDTWPRISATVSTIDVVPPVPKTREEFLRYCRPLSLDESTVSQNLTISQENRRVTSTYYVQTQNYDRGYSRGYSQGHTVPQVLQNIGQVRCREGLSERCYWEVSWSGVTWSVAVSYKDGSRTDFGTDNKSWSFTCSTNGSCTFRHNNKSKAVSGFVSSSIGVYLDYKLGTLSFYNISNTMTLLHKEHITFTEPLYPGFKLENTHSQYDLTSYYAELVKLW